MDEARFGQQGTITDVWARTGSRPRAVRQTRYEWVYLYAAVEPATGESAALLAPNVNTGTMNAFLKILDAERKRGRALRADHGPGGLAQEPRAEAARRDHGAAAAAVLARS